MTAEDLKVLSETELREELDNLRRPYRERMAFLAARGGSAYSRGDERMLA